MGNVMHVMPSSSTEEDCDLLPKICDCYNSYFAPDIIYGYTYNDICLFFNSLTLNGLICCKKAGGKKIRKIDMMVPMLPYS